MLQGGQGGRFRGRFPSESHLVSVYVWRQFQFGLVSEVMGPVLYRKVFGLVLTVEKRNSYTMSGRPSPLLSMLMASTTSSPNWSSSDRRRDVRGGCSWRSRVTVYTTSGLTKAYRSVLSATGSLLISRCLAMR